MGTRSTRRGSSSEKVAIGVSQRVYALFPAYNYSPWQALAEFVDNSLSSWQRLARSDRGSMQLEVSITWDPDFGGGSRPGKLVILDNAGGVSTKDLDRAFRLATPPADLTHLNQFGVGMKVAACWFAQQWTVETSAIAEPVERTIPWNTRDIVAREVDQLSIQAKKAPSSSHYTRITHRADRQLHRHRRRRPGRLRRLRLRRDAVPACGALT